MTRDPFLPRRCEVARLQVLLSARGISLRAQVRQGEGPRLRIRRPHVPQQVLPHGRVLRVSTIRRSPDPEKASLFSETINTPAIVCEKILWENESATVGELGRLFGRLHISSFPFHVTDRDASGVGTWHYRSRPSSTTHVVMFV